MSGGIVSMRTRARWPSSAIDRARLRDASVFEHHHPVGESECVDRVVRNDDGDAAEAGEYLPEQRAHVGPRAHVERSERLIEEEQLRFVRDRARDRDALRLASGEL